MDEYLKQLIDDTSTEVGQNLSVTELAIEMKELRERLEGYETMIQPFKERYDYLRKKLLPDAMAAAGMRNAKLVEGGTVYVTTKLSANVNAADREGFYNWLRDNGHGSLIQPNVHPSTLTAWVKEQKALGAPLPPQVHIWEEPTAAIRK
jgi:hypothetical protein